MEKNEVALVACGGYDREVVERCVERAFGLLGGPQAVVGRGKSVFLKVNGLLPVAPEKAVTTHPEVIRAVVLALKPITERITIGDSPGALYTPAMLKRVYEKCGFTRVAEETGASLNFDTSITQVTLHEAKTTRSLTLCGAMLEVDRLISMSKFKTHLQVNVTGSIKNLFGTVPGLTKVAYHSKFKGDAFGELLVDVALAARPAFHVVDAIDAMDGDGPRKGNIRRMGVLAAGADAFCVDLAMMELTGQGPRVNTPLAAAMDRGLCPTDAGELILLGDEPEGLKTGDFKLPGKKAVQSLIPGVIMDRFGSWLAIMPLPDPAKCTGCGTCEEICPENAITVSGGVARVNASRCIRCFCCQELCEENAIDARTPALLRLFRMLGG